MHDERPFLSLDDVAARLDVHYQTVYRWVRSGRLPAVKVNGRYRVTEADLLVLETGLDAPVPPPAPTVRRVERQAEAMAEALTDGDETEASRIARRLVAEGTRVTTLIEAVLVPPLVRIGQAWRDGDLTIYVEHRASAIVERILGEVAPNPKGRRRGTAVVAALSGDRHSLPTLMATAALREDSWRVEHLGADIPLAELTMFVDEHPVDLVVISATGDGSAGELARAEALLDHEKGVPTLIGGGGRTLTDLQRDARAARS